MIICCRHSNVPFVTVYLKSDENFRDRKMEVAICSNCGTILAQLTQFNINTSAYEVIRPNSKKTAAFIKKMQKLEWINIDIKKATRSNMNFVYGLNREFKNGKIYQYSVDFNGTKKLVKVIQPNIIN